MGVGFRCKRRYPLTARIASTLAAAIVAPYASLFARRVEATGGGGAGVIVGAGVGSDSGTAASGSGGGGGAGGATDSGGADSSFRSPIWLARFFAVALLGSIL